MVGRNIKLLNNVTGKMTNEDKEERRIAEKLASDGFEELQKTPPKHLKSVARYEYERVSEELRKMPIRNLDRATLEMYCTWYGIYREAEAEIQEHGIYARNTDGEIIMSKKNPAISIMSEASGHIRSCASSLGLNIDSRLKILIPKKEEKKETMFDKFG